MTRSLLRRILPLAALALAAACSHEPTGVSLRQIELHQARWNAQHLSAYTFTYRMQCFCAPLVTQPATVSVRGGQVVRVVSSTGEPVTAEMLKAWPTIDQIFEQLKQQRGDGRTQIDITWNEPLGYPARVSAGLPNVADSGYEQTVENVQALAAQ